MPKISAYPDGGTIQATDQLVVARAGANKSIFGTATVNAAAHIAASAAVHGLPASVNVLGNRSAAGEFVQRGSDTVVGTGSALGTIYYHLKTVTFPVAFSAVTVVLAAATSGVVCNVGTTSTTIFTASVWNEVNGAISETIKYLAIGS